MPSFEAKHTNELKSWLIKELEPICDADPEVLSDYVLALLRHDAKDGDLQNLLKEQLEDFLAEKTSAFVAKTMGALKSLSYLPANLRPSMSAQPLSHDETPSSSSSRKRTAEDEGRRSPAKMHRAPDEAEGSERLPRAPSSSSRAENRDNRKDRGPKPACRDFHLRGFCPRGDECRYDHTIPAPDFGMNPMMNQQGQPFPMQGMHPQQMQQMYGMPNQAGFPGAPQGQPFWPANGNGNGMDANGISANGVEGNTDLGARLGAQQPMDASAMPNHSNNFRDGGRGGRGGRGGGGGARGTFERRPTSNTTLVIENVPDENLDLIKINEYFKKFGTITNIQIDAETKKALVSYSQPQEAKAAHTSPEVIFNNRFVKVYFQKLDDPGIGAKPRESAAPPHSTGPPLKSNFIPGQTSNKFVRADLPTSKAKEAQETASKKLDALMAEQKGIMTKLTAASTAAEEKKALMGRFSALEGEIKAATEEVRNAVSAAQAKEAAQAADGGSKWKDQKETREKEQLDRELEALSKTGSGSTTEELKAHLAKLQEEAAKLGIDAEAAAAGRGGFRGRARAAYRGAAYRGASTRSYSSYNARGGRGGVAGRPTMSLDNRPTKLAVSDVPEASADKAKEHFKQFGEIESIEDKESGGFTVHYKARLGGERALRAGLEIPGVGPVKASWLVENSSSSSNNNNKEEGGGGHTVTTTAEDGGDEDERDRDDHFRR